jgi:RNA polymerase sigma-70 factor (ECF subfamily)
MTISETQILVERAAQGDELAAGDLLERVRPRLVLWCANRMSPKLRAKLQPEDVAQEVLIRLHRSLGTFRPHGGRRAFLGWMFTVAENRIRDLVDHHGALKRRTIVPRSLSQTSPSVAAARKENIQLLREAMEDLSADHRSVLQLRRIEERDVEEVARLMKRSPGATHTLYWRALGALRQAMRKRGRLLPSLDA